MSSDKNEATNFIIKELNNFINSFSQTRVRYEFDINANVHCVEIVPNQVYHLDSRYIDWENAFTDKFIALFPNHNICFFSDDAIIGINNIQHELRGIQYEYIDITSRNNSKSQILHEQVHIFNSINILNIDEISSLNAIPSKVLDSDKLVSSNATYTTFITHKINVVIDSLNSFTKSENQNQAIFSDNYSMAA